MRDKSINELNYVELRNGNIICLEDITDIYILIVDLVIEIIL